MKNYGIKLLSKKCPKCGTMMDVILKVKPKRITKDKPEFIETTVKEIISCYNCKEIFDINIFHEG